MLTQVELNIVAELLRNIMQFGRGANPKDYHLKRENDISLIRGLVEEGYIEARSDQYFVTLDGLAALSVKDTTEVVNAADSMLEPLKARYRKHRTETVKLVDIASDASVDTLAATAAMYFYNRYFGGVSSMGGDLPRTFTLSESILEVQLPSKQVLERRRILASQASPVRTKKVSQGSAQVNVTATLEASGTSSDEGPFSVKHAGYHSDGWDESHEELLGITPDVEAMASIIASTEVVPPLSIGLFGEWGVGKTFFMRQMQVEIERRCRAAREEHDKRANTDADDQASVPYHREVVPVWFNAWHYMDANLWASIVTNIFDTLARHQSPEDPQAARVHLLEQLEIAKGDLRQAEQARDAASTALKNGISQLEAIDGELALGGDKVSLAAELHNNDLIQAAIKQAKESLRLGVVDENESVLRATTQVEELLFEIERSGGHIRAAFKGQFQKLTSPRKLWGGVVGGVVVSIVIFLSAWNYAKLASTISGFPFMAMLFWLKGKVKDVGAASARLREGLRSATDEIDGIRMRRTSSQLVRASVIERLRAEKRDAEIRLDTLRERDRMASLEFENASAGRMLSAFIKERSDGDDYRKSLGIISQIHEDFKKLQELLRRKADEQDLNTKATVKSLTVGGTEVDHGSGTDFVPIDRVVLYIDDLDRCPPARVVEVIQAVHLLLALELFVVVVAVDSRWVKLSLEKHEDLMICGGNPDGGGEVGEATAQSYLEKIFQIPYTLGLLTDGGFRELVGHLTEHAVTSTSENTGGENEAHVVSDALTDATTDETPEAAPAVPPGDSENAELLNRERVVLHDRERKFLQRLGPFVQTPRAAKRLVNSYRLVRATLDNAIREDSLREEGEAGYKTVAILLAAATGPHEETERLFAAISSTDDKRIEKALESGHVLSGLEIIKSNGGNLPVQIESYRRWAPYVRKYAFY